LASVDFANPPLVETVLGVQFNPLPGLNSAHLGAFWDSIRNEWPDVTEAPALEPQFERFGEQQEWQPMEAIRLRLDPHPDIRLRIRNAASDRMVQVQNGRFHYNWIKRDDSEYARYQRIKPEFDAMWSAFCEVISSGKRGNVVPNQWEVTYVNHIPAGELWRSPSDWSNILKLFGRIDSTESGLELENVAGVWRFVLPDQRGRFYLHIDRGRRSEPDGPELMILRLTARGPILEKGMVQELTAGLDLGHHAIVTNFVRLTTKAAHQHWRESM